MNVVTTAGSGRARRLARIFGTDGRALIVGYDHAVSIGTADGALASLVDLSRASLQGGADGLQMGLHSSRLLSAAGVDDPGRGLVIRIDRSTVNDDPSQIVGPPARWASPTQALQAGGDAAVVFYVHDTRRAGETNAYAVMVGEVARECIELGLPLMVEVMVKTDPSATPEALSQTMVDASRIAFELGADLVKVDRTPNWSAMSDLVAAVPVPILLRGGAPRERSSDTLADLERCLQVGVAGAVYGRTVWQHEDPKAMTRALSELVHGT